MGLFTHFVCLVVVTAKVSIRKGLTIDICILVSLCLRYLDFPTEITSGLFLNELCVLMKAYFGFFKPCAFLSSSTFEVSIQQGPLDQISMITFSRRDVDILVSLYVRYLDFPTEITLPYLNVVKFLKFCIPTYVRLYRRKQISCGILFYWCLC